MVAHAESEITLAGRDVSELVDDGVGVGRGLGGSLLVGDERVADHVHARGEGPRSAHGVEELVPRLSPTGPGDLRIRVEEDGQRAEVAVVGRARVALH